MKIVVDHVGTDDWLRTLEWPAGWPLPNVGDRVTFCELPDRLFVQAVHWCPQGEADAAADDGWNSEPFAYLLVAPKP